MNYKKYSEDFESVHTLDANGRLRSRTVYRGDYFTFENEGMGTSKARIFLGVFLFLFWALWIFGLIPDSTAMRTFYVVAPYVCTSIGILYMTFGASDIVFLKGPFIREGADHINKRFPGAAMCTFCIACASAVGFSVLCIKDFSGLKTGDLLFGITNVLLAVSAFLFYRISKRFHVVKI